MKFYTLFAIFLASCAAVKPSKVAKSNTSTSAESTKNGVVRINLSGRIDDTSAMFLDMNIIAASEAKGIVLVIDSYGGEVSAGYEMVDSIAKSKAPVVCVAGANVMSAAMMVFESCPVRIGQPDSVYMIHSVSISGAEGRVDDLENLIQQMKILNRVMAQQLCRRMGCVPEELLARISGNRMWMFMNDEAMEANAIDFVFKDVDSVIKTMEQLNK